MIPLQISTVVDDGLHNAFTDLVSWREELWLIYTSSPSHFASKRSCLVLCHSENGVDWQEAARFDGHGEDIRDPKLAVINSQLILYALLNKRLDPQPYTTVVTYSSDGFNWTDLMQVTPQGWLLGKPKSTDQATWYAPAHSLNTQQVVLLSSQDGARWILEATICRGNGVDETAIEFTADEDMIAATRMEMQGGIFGNPEAGTLLSVAVAPFKSWSEYALSLLTRLDGPNLFLHAGQIYAVGRYQPDISKPFQTQGSIFSKKRTALFYIHKRGLTHLTDLPSSGDTAYAGTALHAGRVYISYYTNDPHKEYPWLLGMMLQTRIVMASLELSQLKLPIQRIKE